jgi:hypothetical protein
MHPRGPHHGREIGPVAASDCMYIAWGESWKGVHRGEKDGDTRKSSRTRTRALEGIGDDGAASQRAGSGVEEGLKKDVSVDGGILTVSHAHARTWWARVRVIPRIHNPYMMYATSLQHCRREGGERACPELRENGTMLALAFSMREGRCVAFRVSRLRITPSQSTLRPRNQEEGLITAPKRAHT